jgi:O-antigen/teichoic acid export membrane protein
MDGVISLLRHCGMFLKTIKTVISFPALQGLRQRRRLTEEARKLGQRVAGNTLWLLVARLGAQGLMVAFTLIIAQRLGEAGLGAYAFMAAVIFTGNILTTFGTDMLIVREVAATGKAHLLFPSLVLQLVLSTLFILLVYLGGSALPNQDPQAVQALKIFSLALIPLSFYTVFSAALRGYERMDSFMWLNLVAAFLQVGLVWLFIRPESSLVVLAELLLGVQIGVACLAAIFCQAQIRDFSYGWKLTGGSISVLIRASAPLAGLGLLKVLNQRLSVVMLFILAGEAATGWFSAALRTVEAVQIGHIAVLGALFPVMARTYAGGFEDTRSWRKISSISFRSLLILGVGAAALLTLLAPWLVELLFGSRFEPTVPALRILAWTLIPYSVNIFLSSDLLAAGRERQVAIALAAGLLILVGLNGLWIPRWGLLGAGLAAVIAEAVQAGIFLYLARTGLTNK